MSTDSQVTDGPKTSPRHRSASSGPPLRWLLPIRPLQAALWEVAAIAVLLVVFLDDVPQPVLSSVCAVAGLLVAVTSIRVGGRHLTGWTLIWLGHRLRQHDDRRESPDPLHRLAGAIRVRQHVDRAGNRFGVAEVDGGWSAIVRLTGSVTPDMSVLMATVGEAYRRTDIPLESAQLLTWTVPRDTGQPFRAQWLAVRYSPDEAPIAALARGGGELGALRSTACAALSLMGSLAEAGYESTVLEAGELTEELRVSLGVERQGTPEIVDHWGSWSAGTTSQVCFAPISSADVPSALGLLVPSAAFTAVSYTLRRTPAGKERSEVTIRVGTREDGATAPKAGDLDVRAVPLHGRHAGSVRRTLPLALAH